MNAGKIPTTSLREESWSKATSSLHWNESADSITDKASSRIGYNRRTIPPSHRPREVGHAGDKTHS